MKIKLNHTKKIKMIKIEKKDYNLKIKNKETIKEMPNSSKERNSYKYYLKIRIKK